MSKETFSKKISEIMREKIQYLDNAAYDIFFKKDDYFELALCLSYMTLSKEKIIKKDMNNTNRLSRLTRMVSEDDINKVFDSKYFKSLPNIIYAKENDKTWILDNIRDSIMHGTFDIDEDKQCFIINNNQFDRELIAEIPFSWFIEYSKYDILSKKIANKYTIKGFYYNINKQNFIRLTPEKELKNHILYNVKITGNSFNINEIESKIKELFDEYSKQEIDKEILEKYQEEVEIGRKNIKYNKKYLTSFYIAREKIKEKIEKEFPNTKVQIYIDNRKGRLINKLSKRLPKIYKNYNIMYNDFSNKIDHKSNSLLKRISSIIENIDNIPDNYNELNIYQIIDMFNKLIQGKKIKYQTEYEPLKYFEESKKILNEICLNVYGLSTLVINQENLYNQYFLNEHPAKYGIQVFTKQRYIDYATKQKNLLIKKIEKEIKIFDKQSQLDKCSNPQGQIYLTSTIKKLKEEYKKIEQALEDLSKNEQYEQHINTDKIDKEKIEHIYQKLNEYFNHLNNATTVEAKNKIKKIISKYLNEKIEEESKFIYGYCNNMKDVLTVIRNCFSHIGRTNLQNKRLKSYCLIDYDNNQEQSGIVFGTYENLINLLSTPFVDDTKKLIHK